MKIACKIRSWECARQPVFVRADLNVPLQNNTIANDRRLRGIQPTLDELIKKGAIIVLASHIGRPKKKEPHLSTKILIPWFEKQGYAITFCKTIEEAIEKEKIARKGSILLLENLRFFPEEKARDRTFITALASLADWYVNDAFATLHRNDASLADLAYEFAADHRSIGFLIEKELTILNKFLHGSKKPVCAILGGGKIADKLPLINNLLTFADYILLCPALAFTFEKAIGKKTGKSLVDDESIPKALTILKKAQLMNIPIVLPQDYQVAGGAIDGPLSIVPSDDIPDNGIGVSIGPESLRVFNEYIQKSGSIFYNGAMGFPDRPETLEGLKSLLTDISTASGTSIVAGGNSIAIADQLSLTGITYYSTGGGATLTYLSGIKLPGLEPFY